jgi:hypothetical protein
MSTLDRMQLLVTAVAAALCLAACSNNNSNNNASAAAGEHAAQTAAASAGDASDEVNHFQPCEKLSVADVQPFFNTPIKKLDQPHPEGPTADCNFATVDGIQGLQITTVVGSMVKAFTDKPPTDDGKPGIPLAGIGDSAMRESRDIWVYGLKNGVFCMIHGDHSGERVQGAVEEIRGLKLSDAVAQSIPAATAQAVAQNLGTLCNKVWGSGNMTPSFADLH